MNKFDFKEIKEGSKSMSGASWEIFEDASSKLTKKICTSAATVFRKIECGACNTSYLFLLRCFAFLLLVFSIIYL